MTNRNQKQFLAYLDRLMEAGLPLSVRCLECTAAELVLACRLLASDDSEHRCRTGLYQLLITHSQFGDINGRQRQKIASISSRNQRSHVGEQHVAEVDDFVKLTPNNRSVRQGTNSSSGQR
ncbi:hypothetical protein H671_xg20166 [Cricetulus griseus]|uniref:Uncharacterized protein n=1 Tax=Cricetulus griseus TaxID=10029 RepID=A0A061HUV1_CRIGR|nr:hypothetical protein H671_xg20166 [Cricetulus griseus]